MDKGSRRLSWGLPAGPPARRPLRDSLLLYGAFAVVVVLFGVLTGGSAVRSVAIAAVFFVCAVGWTAWRLRRRRRRAGDPTALR
jgi:hypothetical protein